METVRGKLAVTSFWSGPGRRTITAATTRTPTTAIATMRSAPAPILGRDAISATSDRGGRGHVLDDRVEPRAVAERVGEDPVERREEPHARVEVLAVRVE